jgi:V8-like Glu-specific endopeptidase
VRLDKIGRQLIRYSVDICPAISGAPVWLKGEGGAGTAIVHSHPGSAAVGTGPLGGRPGTPSAPPGHFNAAVRITAPLLASTHASMIEANLSGNLPCRKSEPA